MSVSEILLFSILAALTWRDVASLVQRVRAKRVQKLRKRRKRKRPD